MPTTLHTVLSTIRKARKSSYTFGRMSGDVIAVGAAVDKRSAAPVVKRIIRKAAGRGFGRLVRMVVR